MPYTPTVWADEVPGGSPLLYKITETVDGDITPGAEIELVTSVTPGTPVNASNLNKLEQGLEDAALIADQAQADATEALEEIALLQVPAYVRLEDQKAVGTDAGGSTANAWTARVLNTEVADLSNLCALAANQFTLQPGTYYMRATAPFFQCNAVALRLWNVTNTAVQLNGQSSYLNGSGRAEITGQFTIASAQVFELRYIIENAVATFGLGTNVDTRASNYNSTEIYAVVELWKIG